MPYPQFHQLSGYLLEWPADAEISPLARCPNIGSPEPIFGRKWQLHTFVTTQAFHTEPGSGPYEYPLYMRSSDNERRFVLLSMNSEVIDFIRQTEFESTFTSPPKSVAIGVNDFVHTALNGQCPYALSFAHCRVDAFAKQLRAISFWGEDLIETPLFRELLSRVHFINCGVRKEEPDAQQILRFGADGKLSYIPYDPRSLHESLLVLKYLQENGFTESLR